LCIQAENGIRDLIVTGVQTCALPIFQGGRALGKNTPDAAYIDDPGWAEDRPVYAEDIAATIYSALGINYTTVRHDDPLGRGFEYVPSTGSNYVGAPIVELFR